MSIFLTVTAFIALAAIISGEISSVDSDAKEFTTVCYAFTFAIFWTHLILIETHIGLI